MKIDIKEIAKENLTIEEALTLVYMESIRRNIPYPGKAPEPDLYLKLIDYGVLKATVDGFGITTTGFQTFRKITGQKPIELKVDAKRLNFGEFWEEYPATDAHGNWLKTRNLKADKTSCLNLYKRIVLNGVPHSQLMSALKHQVQEFKDGSVTSNRLTFMKSSVVWLRRGEYEIVLEELKNIEGDDKPLGSTNDSWVTDTV